MKKTITIEIDCCDVESCGREVSARYPCMNCGVVHCHNCRKTQGVVYNHRIYGCGTGDAYYCNACDALLRKQGADVLHNAYTSLGKIRKEIDEFVISMEQRASIVEDVIKKLNYAREGGKENEHDNNN